MDKRTYKEIPPVRVCVKDVFSIGERRILRDAVEHYQSDAVEAGDQELYHKLKDLDDRLATGN